MSYHLLSSCRLRLSWMLAVTLVLTAASSGFGQAVADAEPETAVALPSAKELLEMHIKAVGGREKLQAQHSAVAEGKIKMPELGIEAKINIWAKAPNQFAMEFDLPGAGLIRRATDGNIAWEINPMTGARVIEGKEKDQFMKEADLHAELNPDKYYKSMETIEEVTSDGRSYYKVKLVTKDGGEEFRYYDADTHLLAKMEQKAVTQFGDIDITVSLDDYRETNGITMPFELTQEMMGQKQAFVFDTFEVNVEVDDSHFAVPEEIQELIQKDAEKENAS